MIIRCIPIGVVTIDDDSTCSSKSSTNGEMIAFSPNAVSPRESTVEEANGRDDVNRAGVVLGDLEDNFGHKLLLFEEYPWFCSRGVVEMDHLEMLNLLEALDCLELCELSLAMSMGVRDKRLSSC